MAIENVNTIDERRSKIVRNRVFDCHLSPRLATNDNRKLCFYRFLIRVCRLWRAFSIAAYPVCLKRVENKRECALTLFLPMEFPMKLIQLRQAGSLYILRGLRLYFPKNKILYFFLWRSMSNRQTVQTLIKCRLIWIHCLPVFFCCFFCFFFFFFVFFVFLGGGGSRSSKG